MSDYYINEGVAVLIQALCADAYLLNPLASDALVNLRRKVDTEGAGSLTPAEGVWLSTLISERSERRLRERLMAAVAPQ